MSTVESLNPFKQLAPVRLAASANVAGTYYNGTLNNGVGATLTVAASSLTVDSVLANLNDFVLLAGQTAAYENGVYQVTLVSSTVVLTRRGDFQCVEQISGGQTVSVFAGTALGGSIWTVIEPLPQAIGVPVVSGANNIVFAQS